MKFEEDKIVLTPNEAEAVGIPQEFSWPQAFLHTLAARERAAELAQACTDECRTTAERFAAMYRHSDAVKVAIRLEREVLKPLLGAEH